jgi:hypothetical protein
MSYSWPVPNRIDACTVRAVQLLIIGATGLVVSVVLIIVGHTLDARAKEQDRNAMPSQMTGFFSWSLSIVKKTWPALTDAKSTTGERIAALGTILAALSVLAIVGGIAVLVISGTVHSVK